MLEIEGFYFDLFNGFMMTMYFYILEDTNCLLCDCIFTVTHA